jgi:hypothetical protein
MRSSQLSGFGSFVVVGKDTLFPVEYPKERVEREVSSDVFMEGLKPQNNRWNQR